jgi:hypothetical protein
VGEGLVCSFLLSSAVRALCEQKRETGSPVSALIAGELRPPGSGCGSGSSGTCTPPVLPPPSRRSPGFGRLVGLYGQAISCPQPGENPAMRLAFVSQSSIRIRSIAIALIGEDRDHNHSATQPHPQVLPACEARGRRRIRDALRGDVHIGLDDVRRIRKHSHGREPLPWARANKSAFIGLYFAISNPPSGIFGFYFK